MTVFVCGLGAVSPAGWNVQTLREALARREPLPIEPLDRPGWARPLQARFVPNPNPRPAFLGHPRLRRTSPITHYAAAAALEAVERVRTPDGTLPRLGIITCLQTGCVQYSYRFFAEALMNPATASPMLFPETVFAAPASHVAALLEHVPQVSTLLGDPAVLLQGVALAAEWLENGAVEACLVIGSEEINWLRTDALWHLDRRAVISGGAGAICLSCDPAKSLGVELSAITAAHTYTSRTDRFRAARRMRAELPVRAEEDLLCDGLGASPHTDAAERAVWQDWTGARLGLKPILGEGLMAAAAWQCVAACDAVASGRFHGAAVSLVGCNQQAIGARFVRSAKGISDLSPPPATGTLRA